VLREQSEGEHRQWQRQVWASALTWGAEPPQDLMTRILPSYTIREEGAPRVSGAPYPVSKALAAALGEAMGLGLLDGPVWTSWPAARDGRPLIRIWAVIALSGGLT
jgi:hypothetical protein